MNLPGGPLRREGAGRTSKDTLHYRTRVWPCQSVLELEPSRGTVVMGTHKNRLVVTKKWRRIFSDSQLAEGFGDGVWLCHFGHMGDISYKFIELNLQPCRF